MTIRRTPSPGTPLLYTDLHRRRVRCRYLDAHDPTVWKVELVDASDQLAKWPGEVAHIAVRFLRPIGDGGDWSDDWRGYWEEWDAVSS